MNFLRRLCFFISRTSVFEINTPIFRTARIFHEGSLARTGRRGYNDRDITMDGGRGMLTITSVKNPLIKSEDFPFPFFQPSTDIPDIPDRFPCGSQNLCRCTTGTAINRIRLSPFQSGKTLPVCILTGLRYTAIPFPEEKQPDTGRQSQTDRKRF